ncbi:DUF21 domain-containing protein [Orobanche hederae]
MHFPYTWIEFSTNMSPLYCLLLLFYFLRAPCTIYGLAVGENFVWLLWIMMLISYHISYPVGKILDCVLGHNEVLFRRPQLKALVSIHNQEGRT